MVAAKYYGTLEKSELEKYNKLIRIRFIKMDKEDLLMYLTDLKGISLPEERKHSRKVLLKRIMDVSNFLYQKYSYNLADEIPTIDQENNLFQKIKDLKKYLSDTEILILHDPESEKFRKKDVIDDIIEDLLEEERKIKKEVNLFLKKRKERKKSFINTKIKNILLDREQIKNLILDLKKLDKKKEKIFFSILKKQNDWAYYKYWHRKISFAERCRKDLDYDIFLEVKCAYCGRWFRPSQSKTTNRYYSLIGKLAGENRLYCSDGCKFLCPTWHARTPEDPWQKPGVLKDYSREVQPELRQMVFERDLWTCYNCRSEDDLQCHHVEGIRWEPIESADIDNCITVCVDCHVDIHSKEGCSYHDMRCPVVERDQKTGFISIKEQKN